MGSGCEGFDLTVEEVASRYAGLYLSFGGIRPGEVPLDLEPGDISASDGCQNGAGLTVNCGRTSALDADRRRSKKPVGLRVEDESGSFGAMDLSLLCGCWNSLDSAEMVFSCLRGSGDGDRTLMPGPRFCSGPSIGGETKGVVCLDLGAGG